MNLVIVTLNELHFHSLHERFKCTGNKHRKLNFYHWFYPFIYKSGNAWVKGIVKSTEPCKCVIFLCFKDTLTSENQVFFKRMKILIFNTHLPLSSIISPFQITRRHSSDGCLLHWKKLVT